ncbi:MAG: T9SS type A sorting domain-containing protein, partial [Bacteroidales bacterium]|nr:T9SS type A sorting domain-containing protein [Bacteroidales bacterium]
NPTVTENEKSIWLYLNTGSDALPEFRLETKEFLQDQMIDHGSGAYPVVFDIFGSGKKDLIVGNVGTYIRSWYIGLTLHSEYLSRLVYYENTGDENDLAFQLMDDDLAGLSSLKLRGLVPAIADISGNGLPDLIVGNETGKLIYAEQTAPKQWTVQSQNYLNINVGSWSSPQLFDLDEDGTTDLIIGSRNGKITFYKGNQSNGILSFDFVTDNLGGVNVTDFALSYDGFSTPGFFYAPNDELMLLVGSEQGKLFLFDQIRGNLGGVFRERTNWESIIDTNLNHLDLGMRTAGWIGQLVESEKLQLVAGNYSGGLQLFNAEAMVAPGLTEVSKKIFEIFPNPANNQITIKLIESISSPIYIGVYDIKGRKVLYDRFESSNSTKTIGLQFLKGGIYVIKLENNDISSSVKMIKY